VWQCAESYWWEFMTDTYATTQTTAVRRQLDSRADVASLWRLLDRGAQVQSIAVPRVLVRPMGRRRSARAQPVRSAELGRFAGGGDYIDAGLVAADQEALQAALREVKTHVDEHVAHTKWTANPVEPGDASAEVTLTLEHVHQAVDHIGSVFKHYYLLLTARGVVQLEPVIQHDWIVVFRQPWIKPSV
jgi:hypothetical protein